jgi:hypothetical protein
MNILIDYTNAPSIIEWTEALGKSKFKNIELEILLKGFQVIPPSQTICKKTEILGQAREFQNDKMFYEISEENGFVFDYLKGLFTSELAKKKKQSTSIKERVIERSFETPVELEKDKYLELLFSVIKNELNPDKTYKIDFDKWFQICGILKHNGYDKKIFIDYTKISSNEIEKAELIWNGINITTPMSIYGLQTIAKEINPVEYQAWFLKYKQYISLKTLGKGENDIAKDITERLKDQLVYCSKRWYSYDEKSGLWRIVEHPSAKVVNMIQSKIDESKISLLQRKQQAQTKEEKEKFEKYEDQYKQHYNAVGKGGFKKAVMEYLQDYLYEANFDDILDSTPYQIAYKDGILDLKTLKFRKGLRPLDYLTKTIPFPYEKARQEDIDKVKHEMLKIANNNPEHLEYELSALGYTFTGDSKREQLFWNVRGQKASNGKSVIWDALRDIAPNYVSKLQSNIFEKSYGSRHKEIAEWRGVRATYLPELTEKEQDGGGDWSYQ